MKVNDKKDIREPFILKKPFKFTNYGEFYFPQKELIHGLEELIIFSEGNVKNKIPNGSVWVYNFGQYKPEILNSDVGCGISSTIIPKIDDYKEIVKAVNSLGTHIGQGNHFINLTEHHPLLVNSNMLFLHTDFNNDNIIPSNYKQAVQMQNNACNKRQEYLDKLSQTLGVKNNIWWDWTHNSVTYNEGKMIYRKGAIDFTKSNGEGLLALNPFEGFLSYLPYNTVPYSSLQHGTGKKNISKVDLNNYQQIKEGMVRALIVPEERPPGIYNEYNEDDDFRHSHRKEIFLLGYIHPKLVIKTKR